MAKLESVLVVGENIEVGGVTYERTTEDVRAGDIVQCFEHTIDLSLGAFYEIFEINADGDIVIIDNAGDERYRYQDDSDFVHFRKVGGEDSGIIEHDGVRYRKVRRRAEAGEKVVITNTSGHFIKMGEVVTAIDSHRLEANREQFTDGRLAGFRQYVDPNQYFVLEPIAPAFKVGDYVRVITDDEDLPKGTIGKITEDDGTGDYNIRVETLDGSDYDWLYDYQLEKVNEQTAKWAAIGRKVGEFKVGDVVRFRGSDGCHGLNGNKGVITVITEDDKTMAPYRLAKPGFVKDRSDTWSTAEHLELIAPVESVVNLAGASE